MEASNLEFLVKKMKLGTRKTIPLMQSPQEMKQLRARVLRVERKIDLGEMGVRGVAEKSDFYLFNRACFYRTRPVFDQCTNQHGPCRGWNKFLFDEHGPCRISLG